MAIRLVSADDHPGLRAFYAALSDESRHQRFLGLTIPSDRELMTFCGPDHEHEEGFVATTVPPTGHLALMLGHICMEPLSLRSEEIAIAVGDRWQGLGIGRALLAAGIEWARLRGIARLIATTCACNSRACRLLEGSGWVAASIDGDPTFIRYTLDLDPES